ncbi:very short patch repair endonuclease [Pseudomonas sp. MWU13-2517]|uniref:very short patch repair endonuclease n=1 Tax=Pseudomonas sp. MWU13-2517 TaxID=2929055 RepID=UPI0032C408DD
MSRLPSNQSRLPSTKSSKRALDPECTRSTNMANIRGRDTAPEMLLRKALWHRGFRFRVNFRVAGVRPDIVFTSRKLAVFVDGCFWHGCPHHYVMPRTRPEFWSEKLGSNTRRDRKQTAALIESGWSVVRFWEHEIESDLMQVATDVANAYLDPAILFRDRAMVVKVEPACPSGTLERWYIEYLISNQVARQEMRPRKPKK